MLRLDGLAHLDPFETDRQLVQQLGVLERGRARRRNGPEQVQVLAREDPARLAPPEHEDAAELASPLHGQGELRVEGVECDAQIALPGLLRELGVAAEDRRSLAPQPGHEAIGDRTVRPLAGALRPDEAATVRDVDRSPFERELVHHHVDEGLAHELRLDDRAEPIRDGRHGGVVVGAAPVEDAVHQALGALVERLDDDDLGDDEEQGERGGAGEGVGVHHHVHGRDGRVVGEDHDRRRHEVAVGAPYRGVDLEEVVLHDGVGDRDREREDQRQPGVHDVREELLAEDDRVAELGERHGERDDHARHHDQGLQPRRRGPAPEARQDRGSQEEERARRAGPRG